MCAEESFEARTVATASIFVVFGTCLARIGGVNASPFSSPGIIGTSNPITVGQVWVAGRTTSLTFDWQDESAAQAASLDDDHARATAARGRLGQWHTGEGWVRYAVRGVGRPDHPFPHVNRLPQPALNSDSTLCQQSSAHVRLCRLAWRLVQTGPGSAGRPRRIRPTRS